MDNVSAPATGTTFATDEIGGVHHPRSKTGFGTEGAYTDVSAADPLPVTQDAIVAALADVATGADIATIVAALGAALQVTGPLTDAQLRAAALEVTGPLTDAQLRAAAIAVTVAALPLPAGAATSVKQDANTTAIEGLKTPHYEAVAANAAAQVMGAAGAAGDLLGSLLIVPATTSPGAVTIADGAGGALTVFAGGANSVTTLHPFTVPVGALSAAGAWKVTTGANVSVIAFGRFT